MEKKKKTLFLHIPHELIIQILLRLPVKSLIHLKCVCKSWFSVISDPQFAKSHFQHSTHTPRFMWMSLFRMRSSDYSTTTFHSIDFEQFLNNDLNNDLASFNINLWLPKSNFPYMIKGSCRGFLFIYDRRLNFYVWNPCTGFNKQIPLPPFASKLGANNYIHFDGFGYDQSRDDYLIVVISIDYSTVANFVSLRVEFFSFRDNMWTEIEGSHFHYIRVNRIWSLFSGAIHWLSFRHDLKKYVILVFDLMERKFSDINLPDDFNLESHSRGLWVCGEFLSLWAKDYNNDIVEIWVMKEYKVHSSWTKTHVLPVTNHYLYPMYCTKDGDIIGKNGTSTLVKYNDKGQVLGDRSYSNGPSEAVIMYTESLHSLPGDNEQV